MNEINIKHLIYLLIIFVLIVGGYGIYIENTDKTAKEKQYNEIMNEANAYVTVGEAKKAANYFKEAEKIKPDDEKTLSYLLTSQMNAGLYSEAENTFKKLAKFDDSSDFWYQRAQNMSNMMTNINNINLAVEYIDKAYNTAEYKQDLFLLSVRAKIYLEEYMYYWRKKSTNITEKREKTKAAISEFGQQASKQNVDYRLNEYNYYYQQFYNPHLKISNPEENMPELETIKYSQEDIERIKRNRPQNNYPQK